MKMAILKGNLRRNYNYESPKSHQTGPPPNPSPDSGLRQGNVPPWEKSFCASVGVPWEKVINTKRYMHHADVLNWNDSAGEEAFLNAKHRFWEDINGIPCSIFLPDPDIYNDAIDWNESRNSNKTNSQVSSYATEGHYRKPDSGDCTWASGAVRDDSGAGGEHCEDNSQGRWNDGAEHIKELSNLDSGVDDWKRKCSCNQANESLRDNARGSWSQGFGKCQNKSRNLDTVDDPWECVCHGWPRICGGG